MSMKEFYPPPKKSFPKKNENGTGINTLSKNNLYQTRIDGLP